EKLKNKVTSIDTSVSSLNALKSQVSDLSKATASSIKYDDLALAITNNDTNKNALATAIASNPNKLGDALATSIGSNTTVIQSLQDKLGTNTTFQTAMADTLSSDKYKIKFQGPKGADGNIGDAGALKSNLFDQGRTMWCADGDVCYVPDNKNWVRHPGPNLVLGGKQDKNRWIIHTPNDDRKGMWIAPGNGTDNWDWGKAFNINNDGVRVPRLFIGGWTIQEEGDHLVFKKGNASTDDNQPNLRMASDGNFWISRSNGRGWVGDNLKNIRNPTDELIVADWRIKKEGNNLRVFHKDQWWNYYEFDKGAGRNDKWVGWSNK
ncbi:MAG: hypothetical protein EBU90_29840, partial [Proteobacteria bacterium]|nr:hypothetical protein [Pseudomonadota bacterium]NBP15820.1 hypothetical protein [bacterium]